jgi:glycogen synthase
VLHITPWFPPHRGGIANYVYNLCIRLQDLGYLVSVLTVKKATEKFRDTQNMGLKVNYANCVYLPGWPYATLKSVSVPCDAGLKMNHIIKKGNFDIVHIHGIHYPVSWIAAYLARRHKIHSVLSLHGTYALDPNILSGKTRIEEWLYRNFFSRIFSQTDAVIAPTQTITDMVQKYQKKSQKTLFYTIEYGIDTQRFVSNLDKKTYYRLKYKIKETAVVLLFVGRFEHVKGIIEFSRAVKQIVMENNREVEVFIIGAGSLKSEISSIVKDTKAIHLIDWQPESKIHEFYIASDVFVIPSKFEGLPLTILEAMNAELHIVYSPVGGIPDIIRGYGPKTPLNEISSTEMYRVFVNLLDQKSMINDKSSSLDYAQKFDWKEVSNRITKLYQQIA